jgi:hypothetical protein
VWRVLINSRLQVGCPPPASWLLIPVDLAQKSKLGTSLPSPLSPHSLSFARVLRVPLGEAAPRRATPRWMIAGAESTKEESQEEKTKEARRKTQPLFQPPNKSQQPRRPTLHHACTGGKPACPLHKTNKSSPVPGSGAQADSRRHSHASTANRHSVLWLQDREHCRLGQQRDSTVLESTATPASPKR